MFSAFSRTQEELGKAIEDEDEDDDEDDEDDELSACSSSLSTPPQVNLSISLRS